MSSVTFNKYIVAVVLMITIGVLGCKTDGLSETQRGVLLTKGKTITSTTFNALSTELKKSMAESGVVGAVQYCNIQALPITDSLATKYNVNIKRTSDKVRNPMNKASVQELAIINAYKAELASGIPLKPKVMAQGTENHFYAPILTAGLCLSCHGNKDDIASYDIIKDLYPDDLATDYEVGDLRGIWSIQFLK